MKKFKDFIEEEKTATLVEAKKIPKAFRDSQDFEEYFDQAFTIMNSKAMKDWANEPASPSGSDGALRKVVDALEKFYDTLSEN